MSFFDRFKKKKEQELQTTPLRSEVVSAVKPGTATKQGLSSDLKHEGSLADDLLTTPSSGKKRFSPDAYRVLISPLITEKSTREVADGKYAFKIPVQVGKVEVRQAVERSFGVHVTKVNIQRVRGKLVRFGRTTGRQKSWKKATVTLKAGERIDVYEGV